MYGEKPFPVISYFWTNLAMTKEINQPKKLVFIYDGQCPFCNQFAELLELKSNLKNIEIMDARQRPPEIPVGYDMDIKGAILLKDGEMLSGANAISWICSQINEPSDSLLELLKAVFSGKGRANFLFPILIWARRTILFFRGVPRKFD